MATSATASIGTRILTVTGPIGPLSTVISIPTPAPSKAAAQSILDYPHASPTIVDPNNPIVLFIIQAVIIIALSRILSIALSRLRQPRVIADVIAGIVLGPTAFGRIPNFTNNIFPSASIPYLNLVANIGLVLFLFLVGVETDLGVFRRHARAAFAISSVGLILPFGLGAAVAVGMYNQFVDSSAVSFGHFVLFIGVAMSITAFPVLARILTELRLLQDHVGVTVLAAGVGNDVVGWILLALAVTLVNAGAGISVLYVLLCAIGWTLLLVYIVRPLFLRFLHWNGTFEKGPTQGVMILVIALIFTSAFVTSVIGIHAIFGGFLVGIIMPHHAGFATGLTEKIEDLVTVLFLPLYFVLSGLKTDLGLLSDGSIWGYCVAVCIIAFVAKFVGCAAAAKMTGFTLRESFAVGSLMSCKGLVELIVLNIGLQAGILNTQIFALMVVMALVTTFATTPLTMAFYPVEYRNKQAALRREAASGSPTSPHRDVPGGAGDVDQIRTRFAVVLDRLDHLPSIMAFIKLLQPIPHWANGHIASHTSVDDEKGDLKAGDVALSRASSSTGGQSDSQLPISVDALRLVELTERTSAVMRASETDIEARHDPITNILRTFAGLNSISLETKLAIVNQDEFAASVVEHASTRGADMVIVPWAGVTVGETSANAPHNASSPFDAIFGRPSVPLERSPHYAAFVRRVFLEAPCDVGLFLDRSAEAGSAAMAAGRQQVFFAFHGGPDDRATLALLFQLCRHPGVSATVVRIIRSDEATEEDAHSLAKAETDGAAVDPAPGLGHYTVHGSIANGADTVYGAHSTQHALQSETADNLALARFFPEAGLPSTLSPATRAALARVTYSVVRTSKPLKTTLQHARAAATAIAPAPLLVLAGRGRRGAASHRDELAVVLRDVAAGPSSDGTAGGNAALGLAASSEVRKSLGDVGSALVASGGKVAGALLVVQAGTGAAASVAERKEV